MSPDGRLLDRAHQRVHSVGIFPLIIGRAPESGIVVPEDDVSRQHACVMRTPTGYVVIDTSSHGTFVNGEPVAAQRVLRSGDLIEIGTSVFEFQLPDEPEPPAQDGAAIPKATGEPSTQAHHRRRSTSKHTLIRELPPHRNRIGEWIRRYGVAEVAGTAAAIGGYWGGYALTGSVVASAFAAALSESVAFYTILLLRDMVRDAYAAGARRSRYGPREMAGTWRSLFIEFGPSEILDAAVLRPLCMGLGSEYLGPRLGVVAGKLVADVVFYAAPILTTEARRRRAVRADG
ncbi:MAG: FHA domain-containing protein [Gemmatimonadales bacterium]